MLVKTELNKSHIQYRMQSFIAWINLSSWKQINISVPIRSGRSELAVFHHRFWILKNNKSRKHTWMVGNFLMTFWADSVMNPVQFSSCCIFLFSFKLWKNILRLSWVVQMDVFLFLCIFFLYLMDGGQKKTNHHHSFTFLHFHPSEVPVRPRWFSSLRKKLQKCCKFTCHSHWGWRKTGAKKKKNKTAAKKRCFGPSSCQSPTKS